jgi:predicted DNA-binding protein YlxM (UPF0122 family)
VAETVDRTVGVMRERIRMSILMDAYGNLLTDKQKNIMDLYYNCDLSLGEIAEHTDTTRQAVYDIIRRCHKILFQYEEKLSLAKQKMKLEEVKKNILRDLDLLENSSNEELVNNMKRYIVDNI